MTVDSGPEVSGASARYQQAHIWLLGATMAALAGVIIGPTWIAEPAAAEPDLTWLALLPLFALAEVVVIHLPTLRNAHGHTLREVPAVLGLTFLAPQQYVTAYVVGAVLALVVAARMRGVKLAFNAAMFTFEAALGALAYHAILQGGDPLSPLGWLAVLVAVLITDLISAGAVTAAISLTEGAYDGEVLHEALRSGVVAAFINTCVALLVATLVLVQPSALPLLGVIVVLLVMAYRVYVSLARGHTRTQLLYRFVDRTSAVGSLAEVIDVVLIEAAGLMHAERAYLVEHLDDDGARYHAFEDGALHTGTLEEQETPPWWWSAFDAGVVHHDGSHREHGETPATHGGPTLVTTPRDGLAAPLRGADSARYVLVVCDRSFEKETFGAEDVQVFETLAAHAGVAVERARSVSDLKALAEELEVARDAALSASEAKSMFLANMSHEIRTPLTSVLATSELLGDTPLDDVQLRLLERMNRKGGQLLSLVEALLDFSRIEAGHAVLHHADFDLHALVDGIVEAHLTRATDQGVTLDSELDPRVPRAVTGDEARVGQVLTTLVDNALKFTTDGRVHVHLGPVDGTVDVSGGGVQLTVTDTGIGIGADDQATIFESFRQVDGSATRHYEGTGLGLAIGKALTELMDGTIEVHSELGVGSTFTVRLPLASTDLTQPLTAIAPRLTA